MAQSTAASFRSINEIKFRLTTTDHETLLKPECLVLRHRLQMLCRAVLLNNLETALDQKLETDLWNCAIKSQITALQQASKDKGNSSRKAELQAELNLFLESSMGFYMQLLNDVCETFKIYPPFRRKFSMFGILQDHQIVSDHATFREPSKRSCAYICQYCLVHLGDIARYLQRIPLAENFYQLASRYVPTNGQPYNQLAILSAARSNKLAVTYFYMRAIAVRSPFPVAPTNLEKMYSRLVKDCENINYFSKNKWSMSDLTSAFLYMHGLVHLEVDSEKALRISDVLLRCLASHTIFSMLTSESLLHMSVINLFTLTHAADSSQSDSTTAEEKAYVRIILAYTIGFLEILLNQAPKSNVREHITLPAIKILLDWLIYQDGYLAINIVKTHGCWFSLAKALNAIQSHCKEQQPISPSTLTQLKAVPLPEDLELQSFLPLSDAQENLDFNPEADEELEMAMIIRLRCLRLVDLGQRFCEKYPSLNLIDCKVNVANSRLIFSAPMAIKVETTAVGRTVRQNVAIQAIKSRESSNSTPEPDWLPPAYGGDSRESDSSLTAGDATPLRPFNLTALPPASLDILPPAEPRNNQGPREPPLDPSRLAIGSEIKQRSLLDLLEATSFADPLFAPMNFSASDSSVLRPPMNSYSLFSNESLPFDLAMTVANPVSDPLFSAAAASLPSGRNLSSSSGWPVMSKSVVGQPGGLESLWGSPSALAQLIEEQQMRNPPQRPKKHADGTG